MLTETFLKTLRSWKNATVGPRFALLSFHFLLTCMDPLATCAPFFQRLKAVSGLDFGPPSWFLLHADADVLSFIPSSPSFLLFAFSPAGAASQTFRIPRRTEALLFNVSQLSHTDVHAHLKLCDQTFPARLRVSTDTLKRWPACGKCTESAFTRAALVAQLKQDAKVLWWVCFLAFFSSCSQDSVCECVCLWS